MWALLPSIVHGGTAKHQCAPTSGGGGVGGPVGTSRRVSVRPAMLSYDTVRDAVTAALHFGSNSTVPEHFVRHVRARRRGRSETPVAAAPPEEGSGHE